jgi:hypothetical protein
MRMDAPSAITDNLTKPFSYAEPLARVRALLRRGKTRPARGVIRIGELSVDPFTRAVTLADRPVHVSAKEVSARFAGTRATSPGQEVAGKGANGDTAGARGGTPAHRLVYPFRTSARRQGDAPRRSPEAEITAVVEGGLVGGEHVARRSSPVNAARPHRIRPPPGGTPDRPPWVRVQPGPPKALQADRGLAAGRAPGRSIPMKAGGLASPTDFIELRGGSAHYRPNRNHGRSLLAAVWLDVVFAPLLVAGIEALDPPARHQPRLDQRQVHALARRRGGDRGCVRARLRRQVGAANGCRARRAVVFSPGCSTSSCIVPTWRSCPATSAPIPAWLRPLASAGGVGGDRAAALHARAVRARGPRLLGLPVRRAS